jgi:hypothetical protein
LCPPSTARYSSVVESFVHGNRHRVVGDVALYVLVEVVADARSVRQEVLDRHVVADEREILAEYRPCRRREIE